MFGIFWGVTNTYKDFEEIKSLLKLLTEAIYCILSTTQTNLVADTCNFLLPLAAVENSFYTCLCDLVILTEADLQWLCVYDDKAMLLQTRAWKKYLQLHVGSAYLQ